MFVKGYNGQIDFDGKTILITRKGGLAFLSQGLKGDKKIPIGNVTSVQFKNANLLTNGYIQFATAASESRGGLFDATKDENTIIFTKNMQPEFEELRSAIEQAVENHSAASVSGGVSESPLDALKKLKELLDLGVIDQQEFESKKQTLMGKI